MNIVFHYPPELLNLLIETIPLLFKSKKSVVLFFKGAGVSPADYQSLFDIVLTNPDSTNKYEITRTILDRLNSKGETTLRERREILKRVTEFEDFSTCWPNDQLKAKGLVAEIRRVINIKDTFTRINQEREKERQEKSAEYKRNLEQIQRKKDAIANSKKEFYALFTEIDVRKRGKLLEYALNNLFAAYGLLVKEAFNIYEEDGNVIYEQIDGAIEVDGIIYLVEMKWHGSPIDVLHISRHIVRVGSRNGSRGIFISSSEYTQSAIQTCKEYLKDVVMVLFVLEEIVSLLEREDDLVQFLKSKIHTTIAQKQPFVKMI